MATAALTEARDFIVLAENCSGSHGHRAGYRTYSARFNGSTKITSIVHAPRLFPMNPDMDLNVLELSL